MSSHYAAGALNASPAEPQDVTSLLRSWSSGPNPAALDQLMPLVYGELRKVAARQFRREAPGNTLQSTAQVHEAYLKLVDQHRVQWHDREHFFAVAAQIIRRILVTHSRKRKATKRGGGERTVLYDDGMAIPKRVNVPIKGCCTTKLPTHLRCQIMKPIRPTSIQKRRWES